MPLVTQWGIRLVPFESAKLLPTYTSVFIFGHKKDLIHPKIRSLLFSLLTSKWITGVIFELFFPFWDTKLTSVRGQFLIILINIFFVCILQLSVICEKNKKINRADCLLSRETRSSEAALLFLCWFSSSYVLGFTQADLSLSSVGFP